MKKTHFWLLAAYIVFAALPCPALPVDHEAEDGIAAVSAVIDDAWGGLAYGAIVLGTDGNLYVVNEDGNLTAYTYPFEIEIDWPVEFTEIVDWTPLFFGLPAGDDLYIDPGLIRCRDGSRWVSKVEKTMGGWDMAGKTVYEHEWVRIKGLK